MGQLFLILVSNLNIFAFTKMKHPMAMGVLLLTQTVIICMMTSSVSQNSWFSYILFLVFLGGMLVLFIYMTSVASNEMFSSSSMMILVFIAVTIMLTTMMLMVIDPLMLSNNSEDTDMTQTDSSSFPSPTSMFTYPNNVITVMAVMYLFLTLIVVVKITEFNSGPLRSKI